MKTFADFDKWWTKQQRAGKLEKGSYNIALTVWEAILMSNRDAVVKVPSAMAGYVFKEVETERQTQDKKWGEQNHHPYKWLAILGEEVGESNKAILEGELLEYRDEMIQVAAVAIAAIESLDRW